MCIDLPATMTTYSEYGRSTSQSDDYVFAPSIDSSTLEWTTLGSHFVLALDPGRYP